MDTNIFIYLYSESDAAKREAIYPLFDLHHCVTSTQVLGEACNVWFKKFGWDGTKIHRHLLNIELLCDEIVTTSHNSIHTALTLKDVTGYSFFDCLILASALGSGCVRIMTEDMQDGQVIDKRLQITNPLM